MDDFKFDKTLVTIIESPKAYTAVEHKLAKVLLDHGYVHESYADAIVEREKSYPTGLAFGKHSISMPHCGIEHVITPAICMGVLKHPIPWHRMDDPKSTCNVELVVMLALTEPHSHITMLQRVATLIQNQEFVTQIIDSSTAENAYTLAKRQLC